jgi:kynureninase
MGYLLAKNSLTFPRDLFIFQESWWYSLFSCVTEDAMELFQPTRAYAVALDHEDPLAPYRHRFHHPTTPDGTPCLYFCGNSLGLQPWTVREYIEQELHDWATLGVEGHVQATHPWLPYHELLAAPTARLVGARPQEVVVMNALTVNMHLLLVSFYRPTPERYKIVIEADAFPSDRYAIASHIRWHGYDPTEALLPLVPRPGEATLRTEDIEALLEREGHTIALLWIGGVNYYTGQAFDMARITRVGQAQGCLVGFDLAHAVGNLVLHLHDWGVDCAVWCSYKYLNAGPGAVGGCFVHERHADSRELPRLAGWWGHNKTTRFRMPPDFEPLPGAEGWQVSNPPILQLAALRASMEIFDTAGMEQLRAKSERLTGYLEYLLDYHHPRRVTSITPRDPPQRGAQLSLRVARHGPAVHERLARAHVVCDWREPDVIRVAPVPLYNSFEEVYRFVEILTQAATDVAAAD